jgi:hypothetical protein
MLAEVISRSDAKARGLKKYFTGVPCPRGHVAERYVGSRQCVECLRVRNATPEYKAFRKKYAATPKRKAAEKKRDATPKRKAAQKKRQATPKAKAAEKKRHARPESKARRGKQRHERRQATPAWCNLVALAKLYADAATMADMLGEPFHVDHCYPIKGALVSGLNVPANTCILPGVENLTKHNRVPAALLEWHRPMSDDDFRRWHYVELARMDELTGTERMGRPTEAVRSIRVRRGQPVAAPPPAY